MTLASLNGSDHAALYNELLPHLRDPRGRPPGRIDSFCPAHEDGRKAGRRSLTLDQEHGLRCWAGCEFVSILDGLGVGRRKPGEANVRAPLPFRRPVQPPSGQPLGEPSAVYAYATVDGSQALEKGRWDLRDGGKTFRWRRRGGSWAEGIAPLQMRDIALWGAELVAAAADQTVYVVEGEKAALACRARGLLAVTHPGGASTRDFGDSLGVLTGRDVGLWPDNDPVGREYMRRLHGALLGIASSITTVSVDVPEKGDAHDYFAAGGTAEAIESAALTVPVREFLREDRIRVKMPSPLGPVWLTFEEIEKTPRALEAELTLAILAPGVGTTPYVQRINLLSSSQRTELRRDLEAIYGKDFGWPALLNGAFALAREGYVQQDRGQDAAEIVVEGEPRFTVDTLFPEGEPSVVFGDGSSGKSYLTFCLGLSCGLGLAFAGLATLPGPVLVVDFETTPQNFARRLQRLAAGLNLPAVPSGAVHYWHARGVPLPDQVDALRRKIDRDRIQLVIVDSAAAACGGKPEDADVALRYFGALSKLGVTTVTIAHITKGGDTERPFGSAFWHNEARRTWYVARVQEEESDLVDLGLYCRKVNDGRKPRPLGLRLTFNGTVGPVTFERSELSETPELDERRSLKARIWDRLAQPRTAYELATDLGAEPESVKKALQRNGNLFARSAEGHPGRGDVTRWARVAR